jgi:acetyl-CoA C-acetyltransferase
MGLDSNTPVIVGVGAMTQRVDDPREALEPLDLMGLALERAAHDAGEPGLLSVADAVWIPRGFWPYSSPGRMLGERFGAPKIRHIVSEIGVLQTTLLGHAAAAIASGQSEVALIVGGEARDREVAFQKRGDAVPITQQVDCPPDETLRPQAELIHPIEIELGLVAPTTQYALLDHALRASEGQSLESHRQEIGRLWAEFNRVAVDNPDAWNRRPLSLEEIILPSKTNRMLSFPYTKSLVSQWTVNQAGGLILCSYARALRLGLDKDRFIYPLAVVDSEAMLPLSERREIHVALGFEYAFERALSYLDRGVEEIDELELYSCFPAAVRVQQRALKLDPKRVVTQTGGMTFAGGPLNNFVIQSWVKMVERLREGASGSRVGMVTAVSGFLTKQGVSLLATDPIEEFLFDDVTDRVRHDQTKITVDPDLEGTVRVASCTVDHERDGSMRVVLILDREGERRTLRVVDDADLALEAMASDLCGRELSLESGGRLRWS